MDKYKVILEHDGCMRKDDVFFGSYEECKTWIDIHWDDVAGDWAWTIVNLETGRAVSYVLK